MVKNKLRQLLLIGLFLMLMGCTHQNAQMSHLQHLDSLMEKHTQEVYDTLCQMKSHVEKDNVREVMMKYRILMAKAQNKLYLQMPSDSSFQEVVDYYEKKGTSNERMEANYLLGCIYRDQKEAPMAMQYYQKAVECADTLHKDCDYVTLFSIYGQMSDIFVKQNLYKEAMWAEGQYSKYAYKAGDMRNYVRGKEGFIYLYSGIGDTAKAISQTELCTKLYKKYNFVQEANGVYPTLIGIYVKKGNYQKAGYYMNIFEKESGAFDKDGNISAHREHYYYLKGRYLLGIKQLKLAEFYFRKVGSYGYKYEASKGLLALYKILHNIDSVSKYSTLCEKEMDKILQKQQINAVKQASSMYNYNRMLKLYNENALKIERTEKKFLSLILFLFIISTFFIAIFILYRRKFRKKQIELDNKQKEIEKWNDIYLQKVKELEQNKEELQALEVCKNTVIENKLQKIEFLQKEIQQLRDVHRKISSSEKNMLLDDDEMYKKFKSMSTGKRNTPRPISEDWKSLELMVRKHFPLYFEKVSNFDLSLLEKRVCMLTRLRFTNSEMVVLLDSSPSSISNTKQKVNEKVFGETSAATLLKNLLNI